MQVQPASFESIIERSDKEGYKVRVQSFSEGQIGFAH